MKLREALKGRLKEKEFQSLITSFDTVGDIAILEIPKNLERKEKLIAKAVVEVNKHIRLVCKKTGKRKGKFRLYDMKIIFNREVGKKPVTETIHKEYGCLFKLDVAKVYFSPRELTERQRIGSLVKPNETVMVMFAGVGPFPIIIGKKQPGVNEIIAIEWNDVACEYMKENIRVNKLSDKITPVHGDVKTEAKKYYGKCDRVVMPLALTGYKFLKYAIKCLKRNGTVHFYHVSPLDDPFSKAVKILEGEAGKQKKKVRIVNKKMVLPFGPGSWKVCIDAKVI